VAKTQRNWSCSRAEDRVAYIADVLLGRQLIERWVSKDDIGAVFDRCKSCRGRRPAAAKCCGWVISFRGPKALRFLPVEIDGRRVRVSLEGVFSFRRSAPADERSWTDGPLQTSNAYVIVEEEGSSQILTRQHLDLADFCQPGTVWHLQLGGYPGAAVERPKYAWLDVPRWPAPPVDFVLFVELITFNFMWDSWRRIAEMGGWRESIQEAEDLALRHYYDRMTWYWNHRAGSNSWLAVQCNRTGDWNPRAK
jgi:hypothetical protein